MSLCPECKEEFECKNSSSCWCAALPKIIIDNASNACLCPNCLSKKEKLVDISSEELISNNDSIALKEGIDFSYNDQGMMVLSRLYLLRRGYCCSNGCENCPYEK